MIALGAKTIVAGEDELEAPPLNSNLDPPSAALIVTVPKSVALAVPIVVDPSFTVYLPVDVNTGAMVSSTVTVLVAVPALPEASVEV